MHEAQEVGGAILMAGKDATEVPEPRKQPFDLPAPLVTTQGTPVLGQRTGPIGAMRGDRLDALLFELGIELIAVVDLVHDQSSRCIGDKPSFMSTRDNGDFMWRSKCKLYDDRKIMTVC